jgi:multidrug transporter EmrE-like cation transporter
MVRTHPLILVLIAVVLGAVGQICLKYGVGLVKEFGPVGARTIISVVRAVFTPYVFLGFLFYGLSSVFWLLVLQRSELSYLYPMIAVGYVVVVFLSWVIFHDHVGAMRLAGVALICAGVILVARS